MAPNRSPAILVFDGDRGVPEWYVRQVATETAYERFRALRIESGRPSAPGSGFLEAVRGAFRRDPGLRRIATPALRGVTALVRARSRDHVD
jgi:hypothetical protein